MATTHTNTNGFGIVCSFKYFHFSSTVCDWPWMG
ncbi:hypothetical protein C5167_010568 [Papaver somniferum]|uniref:Uncharacterized protein n=1 Tax=Papaver somniferum TaxID=3469 RepID=A0A4Y7K1T8_PAPSO|nr:hypothetical protein C5167_010568 [Papaver somniferum]